MYVWMSERFAQQVKESGVSKEQNDMYKFKECSENKSNNEVITNKPK